jgi:NADPH-dependent 2,4-dienoyl-CoA reductase/sulfur reductase-like enzyme
MESAQHQYATGSIHHITVLCIAFHHRSGRTKEDKRSVQDGGPLLFRLLSMLVDVAVIGAGVSGLVCAELIVAMNLTVAVIEARGRLGGRVLSEKGIDLGGSWTWPGDTAVAQIARKLGLELIPQRLDGEVFRYHPIPVTATMTVRFCAGLC